MELYAKYSYKYNYNIEFETLIYYKQKIQFNLSTLAYTYIMN